MAQSTLQSWVRNHFNKEDWSDIVEHGCVSGFPYISYTRDCVRLYNRYEAEIWEMLSAEAEAYGAKSPIDFIWEAFSEQAKAGMYSADGFKDHLLWWAVETIAAGLLDPVAAV